jgi:hypothetical protein
MTSQPPTESEPKVEDEEDPLERFERLTKGLFGVSPQAVRDAESEFKEREKRRSS